MGVYIKDMEMPIEKSRIIQIYPDGTVRRLDGSIFNSHFEAVPVPQHGRLIDADALSAKLNKMISMAFGEGNTAYHFAYRSLGKVVENAPTIIPASGGTDNE